MSGAARIFFYNWPIYVATWTGATLAVIAARRLAIGGTLVTVAAGGAVAWSAVSLLVSHYIYDRSSLVAGTWVAPLLPARVARWATIDAGLDAEVALDDAMPGTCVARLDLFDGDIVRAPSVARARARTPRIHAAIAARATSLPLADDSCDVVTVVFTAHEVRTPADRDAFFVELCRVLRRGGRVLLVEHLRDIPNFVAFGPGFLHFKSRSEWLRLAAHAQLTVAAERRVTPFVMAMALVKRA